MHVERTKSIYLVNVGYLYLERDSEVTRDT